MAKRPKPSSSAPRAAQAADATVSVAGAILRGEPLVADGTEGIRGLELSNAMHLSSWTDQTVTLPIDEALFLEKLNEHRKDSKVKTEVTEVTFDTSDSYGSKVSDNTDKGGVKA